MVRPNSGSAGDSRQLSFAASSGDGHWPVSARSKERPRSAPLDVRVRDEIAAYQRTVVRQGRSPGTADCHGGKLVAAARASERYLDRPIFSLDEIYRVDVIAAIFPMDEPAKSTIVKIRHALRDYLRTTKRDADFERACRILKEGLRRAAEPSALRYRIRTGRARQPRYVPNEMEFRAVRARCQTDGHTFVGVRDAAVITLACRLGLRASALVAIRGDDFSWRRGAVYLRSGGKGRASWEREVPDDAVPYLLRYIERFNWYAARVGWTRRIALGSPGTFFWNKHRGPLTCPSLSSNLRRRCEKAGIQRFQVHSLRAKFANDLLAKLGVAEAAAAGGWRAERVFTDFYARPSRPWRPQDPCNVRLANHTETLELADRGRPMQFA